MKNNDEMTQRQYSKQEMGNSKKERASHDEIMLHLKQLLGSTAVDVVNESSLLFLHKKKSEGLIHLTKFDATLGGVGIYSIIDKRPQGVYRGFFYVWLPLRRENPQEDTRTMIHSSCSYLEELLKKIVRTYFWEHIRYDSLPLGTLIRRGKNKIPPKVYDEVDWLSQKIYNFAKHHFNFENDEEGSPEHYFLLDEALAIYLITRKLGLDLEECFAI